MGGSLTEHGKMARPYQDLGKSLFGVALVTKAREGCCSLGNKTLCWRQRQEWVDSVLEARSLDCVCHPTAGFDNVRLSGWVSELYSLQQGLIRWLGEFKVDSGICLLPWPCNWSLFFNRFKTSFQSLLVSKAVEHSCFSWDHRNLSFSLIILNRYETNSVTT